MSSNLYTKKRKRTLVNEINGNVNGQQQPQNTNNKVDYKMNQFVSFMSRVSAFLSCYNEINIKMNEIIMEQSKDELSNELIACRKLLNNYISSINNNDKTHFVVPNSNNMKVAFITKFFIEICLSITPDYMKILRTYFNSETTEDGKVKQLLDLKQKMLMINQDLLMGEKMKYEETKQLDLEYFMSPFIPYSDANVLLRFYNKIVSLKEDDNFNNFRIVVKISQMFNENEYVSLNEFSIKINAILARELRQHNAINEQLRLQQLQHQHAQQFIQTQPQTQTQPQPYQQVQTQTQSHQQEVYVEPEVIQPQLQQYKSYFESNILDKYKNLKISLSETPKICAVYGHNIKPFPKIMLNIDSADNNDYENDNLYVEAYLHRKIDDRDVSSLMTGTRIHKISRKKYAIFNNIKIELTSRRNMSDYILKFNLTHHTNSVFYKIENTTVSTNDIVIVSHSKYIKSNLDFCIYDIVPNNISYMAYSNIDENVKIVIMGNGFIDSQFLNVKLNKNVSIKPTFHDSSTLIIDIPNLFVKENIDKTISVEVGNNYNNYYNSEIEIKVKP